MTYGVGLDAVFDWVVVLTAVFDFLAGLLGDVCCVVVTLGVTTLH